MRFTAPRGGYPDPMAEVVRHGDRWGVVETPGEPPVSEHETKEAALLAAGEGATVREEDPTGLADVQDDSAAAGDVPDEGQRPGARPGDGAVERQAGL